MKYVVTSVWKHPAALDWEKMRQNMAQFKDNPHIAEAQWYEIDETTHGSVVTYHSKDAYETNLATQKEYRAKSVKERSVQMLHEAHGECHSELSSL